MVPGLDYLAAEARWAVEELKRVGYRDEDIGLIGPDGVAIEQLEILTPTPGYDPLRATFGNYISGVAQEFGIYADPSFNDDPNLSYLPAGTRANQYQLRGDGDRLLVAAADVHDRHRIAADLADDMCERSGQLASSQRIAELQLRNRRITRDPRNAWITRDHRRLPESRP